MRPKGADSGFEEALARGDLAGAGKLAGEPELVPVSALPALLAEAVALVLERRSPASGKDSPRKR